MKKEIRNLVNRLLHEELIVQSWGITNIQIIENVIRFEVCGFKYKGLIIISTDANGYNVNIGNKNIQSSLDNIINVLDDEIEKTENYTSDLSKWINKMT